MTGKSPYSEGGLIMTKEQKAQIIAMREEGYGYTAIAQVLSMPKNTIKTFCNRNGLSGQRQQNGVLVLPDTKLCKNCGSPMITKSRTKPRKFCSDKCCREWFHKNRTPESNKGQHLCVCENCGSSFVVYGSVERKYCSRKCYFSHRYSKGGDSQ